MANDDREDQGNEWGDSDANLDLETQTETSVALEEPWLVIIFNDPVNTMEFVQFVLRKVLRVTSVQAEALMWTAHRSGKAVVRRCGHAEAEQLVVELMGYSIQAGLEQ